MSVHDNLIAGATPTFLRLSGDDISYTPAGGSPKTIKAIIHPDDNLNLLEGNIQLQFRRKTITISMRNDTEGQVTVKVRGKEGESGGDSILLPGDSTVWFVVDITNTAGGMRTLVIQDLKH